MYGNEWQLTDLTSQNLFNYLCFNVKFVSVNKLESYQVKPPVDDQKSDSFHTREIILAQCYSQRAHIHLYFVSTYICHRWIRERPGSWRLCLTALLCSSVMRCCRRRERTKYHFTQPLVTLISKAVPGRPCENFYWGIHQLCFYLEAWHSWRFEGNLKTYTYPLRFISLRDICTACQQRNICPFNTIHSCPLWWSSK